MRKFSFHDGRHQTTTLDQNEIVHFLRDLLCECCVDEVCLRDDCVSENENLDKIINCRPQNNIRNGCRVEKKNFAKNVLDSLIQIEC